MIYKKDGINIIQMGEGNISVGVSIIDQDHNSFAIVDFLQIEPGKVGRKISSDDTPHTMLAFTDIDSIDVVIGKLERAKQMMIDKNISYKEVGE